MKHEVSRYAFIGDIISTMIMKGQRHKTIHIQENDVVFMISLVK